MMFCSCSDCPDDECCGSSPILIDLDGGGFKLTGSNDPVRFDLNANGRPEATGWTERGSRTAFLVLDLNSDGRVGDGRELFGNYTPMPDGKKAANGYVALEVYDEPAHGGNGDGRISDDDAIYPKLQLWIDYNHNGRTDLGELVSLEAAGVESINLRYREEKRVDRWGQRFQVPLLGDARQRSRPQAPRRHIRRLLRESSGAITALVFDRECMKREGYPAFPLFSPGLTSDLRVTPRPGAG
jgi:hypothetical protein